MEKFSISQEIIVTRDITADSFEDALDKANEYVAESESDPMLKPVKGWSEEYKGECKVIAVAR